MRLYNLLTEVREAPNDARSFVWFEKRDELDGLGFDLDEVDNFDARDASALDHAIALVEAALWELEPGHAQCSAQPSPRATSEDAVRVTATAKARKPNVGERIMNWPPIEPVVRPFRTATRISTEEGARALEDARKAGVFNSIGKPNASNNQFDALRHSRWGYRTAKEVGPGWATVFGFGHELDNLLLQRAPFRETPMDLHNNGVGIGQARAGGPEPDLTTPRLRWFGGSGERR